MSFRDRTIARRVGVLYILGTVFGVVSAAVTNTISESDDLFGAVSSNESELAIGALLIVAMAIVLALIPVVAYPVLSRHDKLLARAYFLFRSVLEAVTYLLTAIAWLLLIPLSQSADSPRALGEALFKLEGASAVTTIAFLIGAAMFYLVLYKARLVPRCLSGWGLLAIIPYAVPVFLGLFTEIDVGTTSTTNILLSLPLGIQEIVLAVWLIIKGFANEPEPVHNESRA